MIRVADLFCGAGGETTGIVQALAGERYDLAVVDHWDLAMETHERNHPQARHFLKDLQALNPHDVFAPQDKLDLLWASPECTHHSVARGGRPCSDQSRASAWLILKWLTDLYVRRVILENVPEFTSWGPLGADGKPLASKKGETFNAFINAIRSLGYKVEWQMLCAADYGDPTTRTRFFLQAVRGNGRIEWPSATHSQRPELFGSLPWVPARDIIDWSIPGQSIFDRARPLAPATMRRIEAGIRRYWGEWAEPFLVRFNGNHAGKSDGENRNYELELPLGTLEMSNHYGLVRPFMVPFYGERRGQDPRTHSTDEPVLTIPATGGGKFGVVEPLLLPHLGFFHREGQNAARPTDTPLQTVTASHGAGYLVQPFILHQMSAGRSRRIDEPMPTVTGISGHRLLEPFLVQYNGTADAQPIRIPLGTLTSRDRFALLDGHPVTLDITLRMLQPNELAAAMGFSRDYWFAGGKRDQVKQIGNAVPVNTSRALALSALVAA